MTTPRTLRVAANLHAEAQWLAEASGETVGRVLARALRAGMTAEWTRWFRGLRLARRGLLVKPRPEPEPEDRA